jgi:hypothetical protein
MHPLVGFSSALCSRASSLPHLPAFPLSVLNISTDSILHVSASDTAVRYRLLHGLPPLLTLLMLTKFAWYKLIIIHSLSSITELSIRT